MSDLNYDDALALMDSLKEKCTEDVSIFTDRGWGDDPTIKTVYMVVIDGNGQNPIGYISKATFDRLRAEKKIGENVLLTYKARTYHYYYIKESAAPSGDSPKEEP